MLPNQSLFQARSTRPASSIRKHQVSIVHEYSWTFKEIHEVWNDNSNTKLVLKGAVLPSATNKIKQIATLYGDYCEVRVVLHWKAKSEETCWPCGAATWKCLPAPHVYTGNGLHVSSRWSWTDEVCKKKSCYSVLCVQICGAVAALLAFTCHILQNGLLSLMQICTGTVQKLPKPRAIILIPDADHCKHLKPFHFGQNMCCDFPQRCIMCAKDQ